jgi:hypothetical protein
VDEVFHAAPRMQNASHSHQLASVPTGQKRCARIAAAQRARWAKVKGAAEGCKGSKARQTNDVSFGSSQDRSRAAG